MPYSCEDCDCVVDPLGAYLTFAACEEACCPGPPPPPPAPAECGFPTGDQYSYDVCDGELAGDFSGEAYTVEDTYSAFGEHPHLRPDECQLFYGMDAYTVEDEIVDGCCECPCVPSNTTEIHATVVTTSGPCGWNGTVVLTEMNPREDPKDTICWQGYIDGAACRLYITFCCNCDGPATMTVGTIGPTVCAEGCCAESGTCTPLEWVWTGCCNWQEGIGPFPTDCGFCCMTITVTL